MTIGPWYRKWSAGRDRDVSIFGRCALIAMLLAAAVPAAADRNRPAVVMMLAERHDEAASETVIRAVEAQLSDVSVALRVSWVDALAADLPAQIATAEDLARESDAVAVFWCDLGRPDRIYLFFAAPRGGRVLVRGLEGSGAGGLAEALAIIVRTSVEAVIAGGEIGEIVPPRAGRNEPSGEITPASIAPLAEDERLALTVAYRLEVLSPDNPAAHAAELALSLRLREHLALVAGYALSAPLAAEARGVLLEVRRHPAWIGMRGSWRARRLRLGAGIDFQVDVATENVRALAQGVTTADGGWEVQPSLVPSLRVGLPIVRRVELFLAAGADIALDRTRYVVDTADGSVEILATWPVRPRFLAGVEVGLW